MRDALVRQIRFALKRAEGDFEVSKENEEFMLLPASDFDYDEAVDALKKVFGIDQYALLFRLRTMALMIWQKT